MTKILVCFKETVLAQAALGLLVALATGACGGGGEVEVNVVSVSSLNLGTGTLRRAMSPLDALDPLSAGSATPLLTGADEGLLSYKVYFRRIQLCESIEDNGSGYENAEGCATLYENSDDEYTGTEDPTAAHAATFEAAGDGKYYDLLSADDLAALKAAMASSIASGEYNHGLMETHPWVKIKARNGTVCTRSGGTFNADGMFNSFMEVPSLECDGDAEEALVYMGNGNLAFNFAEPMTVGEDPVRVDILFNLDQIVSQLTDGTGQLRDEAASSGFAVPFFSATPVIVGASDTITKETYEFTTSEFTSDIEGSAVTATIRVDLYYPTSDTSRTPIGVTGAFIRTDSTSTSEKFDSVVVEDGTVKLIDWEGNEPLTFERTDEGTESTGTAECGPETGYLGGCPFFSDSAPAAGSLTLTDSDGPTITEIE